MHNTCIIETYQKKYIKKIYNSFSESMINFRCIMRREANQRNILIYLKNIKNNLDIPR